MILILLLGIIMSTVGTLAIKYGNSRKDILLKIIGYISLILGIILFAFLLYIVIFVKDM